MFACCYSCNMTTATQTAVRADLTRSNVIPIGLSFEQRLAVARAGMDAVLAHRHGATLADAQAHVAAAEDEAQVIELDEYRKPGFAPHPVLARARRIIEIRGWTQGFREKPGGALCAERAIEIAAQGQAGAAWDAMRELMNRIAAETGEVLSVPSWNDTRRDRTEVLRLLY